MAWALATRSIKDALGALVTRRVLRETGGEELPVFFPERSDLQGTWWGYAPPVGGIDNSSAGVTVKTAAGAGLRNYLTSVQVSHATLGATTELVIRDGAAGTVIWRIGLETAAMAPVEVIFPIPLKGTANTLLEVATVAAVTGDVLVNAQGYAAP